MTLNYISFVKIKIIMSKHPKKNPKLNALHLWKKLIVHIVIIDPKMLKIGLT
jgi:hypothetical protein